MKNAKQKSRLASVLIIASMLAQSMMGMSAFAETENPALTEQQNSVETETVEVNEELDETAPNADKEAPVTDDTVVDDGTSYTLNSLDEMEDLMVSLTYQEYQERYSNVPDIGEDTVIDIPVADYNKELSEGKIKVNEGDDVIRDGKSVVADTIETTDEGMVVYDVEIEESALYSITVDYYPIPGNGATIERILLIDGQIPFNEARYINFTRVWYDQEVVDENGNILYDREKRIFKKDVNGNEMRPVKAESPEWRTQVLTDSQGFYSDPFKFYLEAGSHTIAFRSASEPIKMGGIKLHKAAELPTHEEYIEQYKNAPAVSADVSVEIQGETPLRTSEQVIYAMNDRTSAVTKPQSTNTTLLNTIGGNGGDKWKIPGQWIKWEFEVPESGLYKIIPRFKQTVNAGLFSSRSVKIDGEYPFKEAKGLQFNYDSQWQTKPLNDGETEFLFYIEKGTHTIEFEVVLGEMAGILREINDSNDRLNDYYRKILMITGTEPDEYTDYEFAKLIPEVLRGMRNEADLLTKKSKELEETIGEKGENTVILDRVALLLNEMGNNQNKIAVNLSNYKSYIGSLGTWLLTTTNQPLQIDYICIQSANNEKTPKAEAGFFESIGHEIGSFVSSFFVDYNSMGASKEIKADDPDAIEVWVTTGRDQATIMRQMVDDDFTNKYGVSVNLKLIAAGTLLPATLAGTGPDVSMDADPVGLGIRNAAIPLNYFEEPWQIENIDYNAAPDTDGYQPGYTKSFSEVQSLFNVEAFVPLTVLDPDRREFADGKEVPVIDDGDAEFKTVAGVERNGVVTYGLPSQMDFPMLFYRKDIFVELGLEVPQTWDDVEDIIRALSENQLEMGFSQSMTQIRMYQTGEEWFKSSYDYEYEDYDSADIDYNDRQFLRTIGIETNLGSNEALDAFQRMTEWFTLYGQPVSYDFANRFRTGEMPIGVASYTLYNQLKVFAPEISGLWEFVQLPGVEKADGTIDHTTPVGVSAVMMMKDAADDITADQDYTDSLRAQNSWKYLQWWVSTDTQARFGKEQVAIMGTAAKYNTANSSALISQSWTAQEKKNLTQQFKSLKGTPMSPGNYIVARYTNFAFYNVVDGGEVASEAMLGYVDDINNELTRKRKEYNFLTIDEYKESIENTSAE